MITINLEKELIKQNKKVATPYELLLIDEYDKLTELVENDALKRVGLHRTILSGKQTKDRIKTSLSETEKFNQERVFHLSQIENICNKYYLKFLPSRYFAGVVDNELPNRITNFEIAYGVQCDNTNTFIIAPIESFDLQKKPKDPLFFYKINSEYFYLIHKWGNDLSITRRLMNLLSNTWFSIFIISFGFTLPFLFFAFKGYFIFSCIFFVLLTAINLIRHQWVNDFGDDEDNNWISFYKKNDWTGEYR